MQKHIIQLNQRQREQLEALTTKGMALYKWGGGGDAFSCAQKPSVWMGTTRFISC